jgi:NAD(P)-dependent dehydrogenase (short-subunit alcohol dehydrogenase family)
MAGKGVRRKGVKELAAATSTGEQSPRGWAAQPVELAPSFVFLASDESRYVNGEILGVTGGQISSPE